MITFDPATKIIQLDTTSASEKDIWTAMVNWSVLSDNLKYGIGMTQLGGVAPVALYIFLELGWKVRPIEADGITTITGNLLVQGGGSPITATIGNWNTLVNMETPVQAVAIEVNTGSGLTTEEHDAIILSKDLLEADEEHTSTTIKKKHKTTKAIILDKNVAGSNLINPISITE